MGFLLLEGPFDKVYYSTNRIQSDTDVFSGSQAEEWVELTAAERATIKAEYAAAGISLIVSVFGSTDVPTTTGADPIATANTMAAWVM